MIGINKAIHYLLTNNSGITNITTKIYPLIPAEDYASPFIVYERLKSSPSYSKDGNCYDESQVEINIVSNDYGQSIELAQLVRESIELKKGNFNGVNVLKSNLLNVSEFYIDGIGYNQSLTFHIKAY